MKTILWAALTANGNYAQSGPDHPPKPQALADFAAQATAVGNFIVGRRTFEAFQAGGGGNTGGPGPFAALDIVVVSRNLQGLPGVTIVTTPEDALRYLRTKGHQAALIAGGAELHNAFLGLGLVDELMFDVVPVIEGKGLNLVIDQARYQHQELRWIETRALGGGVTQLRFAITR